LLGFLKNIFNFEVLAELYNRLRKYPTTRQRNRSRPRRSPASTDDCRSIKTNDHRWARTDLLAEHWTDSELALAKGIATTSH